MLLILLGGAAADADADASLALRWRATTTRLPQSARHHHPPSHNIVHILV